MMFQFMFQACRKNALKYYQRNLAQKVLLEIYSERIAYKFRLGFAEDLIQCTHINGNELEKVSSPFLLKVKRWRLQGLHTYMWLKEDGRTVTPIVSLKKGAKKHVELLGFFVFFLFFLIIK